MEATAVNPIRIMVMGNPSWHRWYFVTDTRYEVSPGKVGRPISPVYWQLQDFRACRMPEHIRQVALSIQDLDGVEQVTVTVGQDGCSYFSIKSSADNDRVLFQAIKDRIAILPSDIVDDDDQG